MDAFKRMARQAKEVGADAIIGMPLRRDRIPGRGTDRGVGVRGRRLTPQGARGSRRNESVRTK